jgi:hypothetical protein
MEPVEPRTEIFFNTCASLKRADVAYCYSTPPPLTLRVAQGKRGGPQTQATNSDPSHNEPLEIVPDCGGGKNESVDAVEHSAMSRKNRTGILDAGTALERGLE